MLLLIFSLWSRASQPVCDPMYLCSAEVLIGSTPYHGNKHDSKRMLPKTWGQGGKDLVAGSGDKAIFITLATNICSFNMNENYANINYGWCTGLIHNMRWWNDERAKPLQSRKKRVTFRTIPVVVAVHLWVSSVTRGDSTQPVGRWIMKLCITQQV